MRRLLSTLLLLMFCCSLHIAYASSIEPTQLDLEESVECGGKFSLSVTALTFVDNFEFYKKETDNYNYSSDEKETHQYLQIDMQFINESMSELNITRLVSGYILFENKYIFNGAMYQRDLNRRGRLCFYDFATGVLEEGTLVFLAEVPNIVETASNSLDFIVTLDNETYKVKLR